MSMTVGGAGSVQWPGLDRVPSTSKTVDRVDSVQKAVEDERSLGSMANGTARRTSPAVALTQQDFEAATRLGPNGVTMKSLDQLVGAPKVDRNPWNPAADRKSVNGYDHIMDSLRTAALRRDAALAGTSETASATTATADTAATSATPAANTTTSATAALAYAPLTANQFGEAY